MHVMTSVTTVVVLKFSHEHSFALLHLVQQTNAHVRFGKYANVLGLLLKACL